VSPPGERFPWARRLAKAVLPRGVRRALRLAAREAPHRWRDWPADLRDALGAGGREPLPPARLRRRVSSTSSRREFEDVGRRVADDVLGAFRRNGRDEGGFPRWLDFGCGAGRVSRHLLPAPEVGELHGADVDGRLVRWSRKHLPRGEFRKIEPAPPTSYRGGFFDVAVVVSIFTHFDEETGRRWAAELARVLRPGGLMIVSTHAPSIAPSIPLDAASRARLAETGFLFVPGRGTFNEDAAFHSEEYLKREWSPWFELVEHAQHGLAGFQDLSVWRRKGAGYLRCSAFHFIAMRMRFLPLG
jgi:SAM-dependent methyltransferase